MNYKLFLYSSLFILHSSLSYATHEVGGYISFKCIGGTTYQATITDYTNTYGTSADRDTMRIYWGDGTSDLLSRLNGPVIDGYPNGTPLCNYHDSVPLYGARKLNLYQGTHTYPGDGTYSAWMDDPDRMANINNIANSVDVEFYMYATLIISPLGGCVNSPVITNPPVCINGCTGQCFYYNPGAYSPDGDSLSYSLGQSLTAGGQVCPLYYNEGATIDPVTGTLAWCSPSSAGIYNFVILITDLKRVYSFGEKEIIAVDTTELELEVNIFSCPIPAPPVVNARDTCVVAGSDVTLSFKATAPKATTAPFLPPTLYVTYSGDPFSLSPPATFTSNSPGDPVNAIFKWNTNCPEVREQPYQVTVKADYILLNEGPSYPPYDTLFIAGIGTSQITVVGPAPPFLDATVLGTTVCLNWGQSPCPQITGYNIYRHLGCSPWAHGYCETGVPTYTGYTLIGTTTGLNNTTLCDSNGGAGLSPGVAYSYIVDALYPLSDSLYPLSDGSQSYASKDTCVVINLTVPLITNASVTKTDPNGGEIFIRWMKPFANDTIGLDTTKFPPPYKYVLLHATGMSSRNFTTLETIRSNYFKPFLDTTFMDTGLNTQENSYNYKVDFYDSINGSYKLIGSSGTASSIYLGLRRGDHSMTLNLSAMVPWNNDTFDIYRQLPSTIGYNFIAKTTNTTYTDTDLSNGYLYCYYVKSISQYTAAPEILHPLFDSSETVCGIPADTIAPCAPPLKVAAKCTLYEDSIIWSNPNRLCPKANKVVSYQIYYTPVENGDMSIIATITPPDTLYVNSNLTSVAGCYAVIAVDSAGQTSPFNTVCVDNCPQYQLPNVFTPNGDGVNDLFTPLIPYRYIASIDIDIYNRWGTIMFHTNNPMINWNGNDEHTSQPCPDGVYYYICTVNEIRVDGIKPVSLHGYVQILRGK